MREEAQRPRSRDRRVLLAERPRGRIARVGEDLAARSFLPLIERFEVGFGHVYLAADFEHARRARTALRNIADRPHIGGHGLTDSTVAARRAEHQLALFIPERTTKPVDLGLGGHRY